MLELFTVKETVSQAFLRLFLFNILQELPEILQTFGSSPVSTVSVSLTPATIMTVDIIFVGCEFKIIEH